MGANSLAKAPRTPHPAYTRRGDFNRPRATPLPQKTPPDTKRGVGLAALHRSTLRDQVECHWWMERAPSLLRLTAGTPWERIHSRKTSRTPHPAYTRRGDFNRPRATQLPQKTTPDTERGVGWTALHRSTMRGQGERHGWMERAPSPLRLTASPPWERIHSRKTSRSTHPAYTCRGDFNRPRATPLPQRPLPTPRGAKPSSATGSRGTGHAVTSGSPVMKDGKSRQATHSSPCQRTTPNRRPP